MSAFELSLRENKNLGFILNFVAAVAKVFFRLKPPLTSTPTPTPTDPDADVDVGFKLEFEFEMVEAKMFKKVTPGGGDDVTSF